MKFAEGAAAFGINISRFPKIYLPAPAPLVVAAAPRTSLLAPVVIFPFTNVSVPRMVGEVAIVNPAVLLKVTLFENVVGEVPEIFWAIVPLKVTRLVPWVKVPLLEKSPPTSNNGLNVGPE